MKIITINIPFLPKSRITKPVHRYKIDLFELITDCVGETQKIQLFEFLFLFLNTLFLLLTGSFFSSVSAKNSPILVSPNYASIGQAVVLNGWRFNNAIPELVWEGDPFVSGIADSYSIIHHIQNSTILSTVLPSHLSEESNKVFRSIRCVLIRKFRLNTSSM